MVSYLADMIDANIDAMLRVRENVGNASRRTG
jgi:hypothetical protein